MRTILLTILLTACAKPSDMPSSVNLVTDDTSQINGLINGANKKVSVKLALETVDHDLSNNLLPEQGVLKKCVFQQRINPSIRDICLFAAVLRKMDWSELHQLIQKEALQRPIALAAEISLGENIERWSNDQFFSALSLAQELPEFLQLRLIASWTKLGAPTALERQKILQRLELFSPDNPEDFTALNQIYDQLHQSFFTVMQSFCSPTQSGEIKFRCWRVIGLVNELDTVKQFSPLLPQKTPLEWTLFLRNFPSFRNLTI